MATLKQIKAPKSLSVKIAGESLFNDGVGIVLFITLYQLAFSDNQSISPWSVAQLFAQQTLGGIAYGVILGVVAYKLMKAIDDHKLEILITIAVTTGGYTLAHHLNLSGPLAMVVAGLFIGNRGRNFEMSIQSKKHIYEFWELLDEILNAILFLLIGFEILAIQHLDTTILPSLLMIPLCLLVRAVTVALPLRAFKVKKDYPPYTTPIIIWGGLRGGLAVALALVIPGSELERALILSMTYAVVLFSIIVQGSTAKHLIEKSKTKAAM